MSAPKLAQFETRLAKDDADVVAGQALRYQVFVKELGADGPMVDHEAGLERDDYDAFADQFLLLDMSREEGDQVVGVYRLMDANGADAAGAYYTEREYDLGALRASGRRLLELGRSCLHPDYRGGPALMHLWQGLAGEVRRRDAEILFGVASFHGTDMQSLAGPLTALYRGHLAPDDLRVRSKVHIEMDCAPDFDRVAAMTSMPPLIKAYLRLGGFVGDGAFADHDFNTTDVCLILDTARLPDRSRALYVGAS